jgi:DNA-binding XRE family transcriptional regulator
MAPENLNVWPENRNEWPKHLNAWRCGYGYGQAELAERLDVDRVTLARWEAGISAIPALLPLARKGLSFSHGSACTCALCYTWYPREARQRDIRETRPRSLRRPAPVPAQQAAS